MELDAAGLPAVGPTTERDEDGERIVAQRVFWSEDDYRLNIENLMRMASALGRECWFRYKRVPSLEALAALHEIREVEIEGTGNP